MQNVNLSRVFPARVGMNRGLVAFAERRSGVPRASGDEPQNKFYELDTAWVFPARVGMNRQAQWYG